MIWHKSFLIVILLYSGAVGLHIARSLIGSHCAVPFCMLGGANTGHSQHVPVCSLGLARVIADVQWFRLLQQTVHMHRQDAADCFYIITDHIINLDSHFDVVYRYGAQVMSSTFAQPALGVQLLRKGMRSPYVANDWRTPFLLSYWSYELGDRVGAREVASLVGRCKDQSVLRRHIKNPPAYVSQWVDYMSMVSE